MAAAWQASIGSVAAGSLFASLQSAGMLYALAIPLTGGLMVGATAAFAASKPVMEMASAMTRNAREWMKDKVKEA